MYILIKYWHLTMFFFSKKSYKYFTSYRNDDDKIKSLLYV